MTDVIADLENCREVVIELQKAYLSLLSGNTRMRVRFNDRWTEYTPGKAKELLDLINTVKSQCDDTEGLLNVNRAYRAKRGRPARFFGV